MIERMKNEYSCEGEKTRIEIPRTGRITLPINSPILVMYRKENTQNHFLSGIRILKSC